MNNVKILYVHTLYVYDFLSISINITNISTFAFTRLLKSIIYTNPTDDSKILS